MPELSKTERLRIDSKAQTFIKEMEDDWEGMLESQVLKAMNFWIIVNNYQGILVPKVSFIKRQKYHLVSPWRLEKWEKEEMSDNKIGLEDL